ncbi:MAG: hypothetical protein LBS04_03270 [Tannerellaceae bacterium]|jgi:hypothetical protein|nr:hypothetical protein [Tannerellaceae bacterium]
MNKKENELDQLTRRLFTSVSFEPSADLNHHIMERIAKEQPLQRNRQTIIHMQSRRFSPWLILAVIAYLVAVFLILYMYGNYREGIALFDAVKGKIPYLLTVCAIFGSFPFFHAIDRALS